MGVQWNFSIKFFINPTLYSHGGCFVCNTWNRILQKNLSSVRVNVTFLTPCKYFSPYYRSIYKIHTYVHYHFRENITEGERSQVCFCTLSTYKNSCKDSFQLRHKYLDVFVSTFVSSVF